MSWQPTHSAVRYLSSKEALKRHFGDAINSAAGFNTLFYADAGDLDFSASKTPSIEAINLEARDNS